MVVTVKERILIGNVQSRCKRENTGSVSFSTAQQAHSSICVCSDQPNRALRTRMLRGVGGGSCEAPPYPDLQFSES